MPFGVLLHIPYLLLDLYLYNSAQMESIFIPYSVQER